jgi:cytochrome c-type biogenesis protein CcmH
LVIGQLIMTWFAFIAIAFTGAAVLFLVLPLLRPGRGPLESPREANALVYRDQLKELERDLETGTLTSEHYTHARAELERRLLDDVDSGAQRTTRASGSGRRTALAVAVAVPASAALLYLYLGNPQALTAPKHAAVDASSISVEQFKQMTEKLAARMQSKPDDPVGWMMLGRAYKALERYPAAVEALQHAEQLAPTNPEVLVEYAEALALNRGGNLEGEPARLIDRALKLSPDDQKALTLAGTAAFGRKDYAAAVRYWERLKASVPADSELARALSSGITEAKARARGKVPEGGETPRTLDAAKTVSGVVRLSPTLAASAAPDDAVFVFARAAEGPRMPLAVLRKQVKDLPLRFELNDSMAMARGRELSSVERLVVGARVSKSGSATPQAGDLEGASQVIQPGARGVQITIDRAVR